MKKYILILIILISLIFGVRVFAKNDGKEIFFDDMTTKNFISKAGYLEFYSIKKICSYDYCDYIKSENVNEALNIFTKNYLKTINDEEVKSTLKVKGVKITSLILN